jgi:hypothetical protein
MIATSTPASANSSSFCSSVVSRRGARSAAAPSSVRLEGVDGGFSLEGPRTPDHGRHDPAVTEVHAVEVADRQHAALERLLE